MYSVSKNNSNSLQVWENKRTQSEYAMIDCIKVIFASSIPFLIAYIAFSCQDPGAGALFTAMGSLLLGIGLWGGYQTVKEYMQSCNAIERYTRHPHAGSELVPVPYT